MKTKRATGPWAIPFLWMLVGPACRPGETAGRDGVDAAPADAAAREAPPPRPPRPDSAAPERGAADALPPAAEFLLPHVQSAPWRGVDVGDMASPGIYKLNTPPGDVQTVFISATGPAAGGTGGKADAAAFLCLPVRGDAQVLALPRVLFSGRDMTGNMAGIMIRESLAPDAAMIFVGPNGDATGGRIIYRRARGAEAVTVPAADAMSPRLAALRSGQWVRIRRKGNQFLVYAGSRSVVGGPDALQVAAVELALASPGAEMHYGFAVVAEGTSPPFPAEFGGGQVDNLLADPTTASLGHIDVSTTLGAAIVDAGRLRVTGWGQPWTTDAGNHKEFFTFLGVSGLGDLSVVVRVDRLDDRAPDARVGLMYRYGDVVASNLSRSAAGASISLGPRAGLQHHARASGGQEAAWTLRATDAAVKAPVWLRLDKASLPVPNDPLGARQNVITTYAAAPDSNGRPGAWSRLGESVIAPAVSAIGVHVAAASASSLTTVELSGLAIQAGPPPAPGASRPDAAASDVRSATDAQPDARTRDTRAGP